MTDINEIFGGNTLKAADIQGKEPTVTIETVTPKEFNDNGKPSKKLVISFVGKEKTFVCNVTNARRIAFLYGNDYEQWPGKKITLFVDPFVEFGGQLKPSIRVKPTPAARKPAAEFDGQGLEETF